MNEIEQRFYDAFTIDMEEEKENIEDGCVIGPYKVDFVLYEKIVVEIDGHDSHKTKEQRSKDYARERFLQKEGYTVVRFMGTEVFLDAKKCAIEAMGIDTVIDNEKFHNYEAGIEVGKKYGGLG